MKQRVSMGLASASLFIIASAANAQSVGTGAKAQSGLELEEIVVTARRREENVQDVPISMTVLSQDTITKRNIYNAGDLGNFVPSLSTNTNFGPEKSSFAIRGFVQEGKTSPSVAVYFADVVAPRSNGGTTAGNGAGVGSFMDLQNVQVLKGPQGTLFGRNTTGGAILLVPAKPTSRLEGSIEASAGDYNMHRLQGVLNVPVSDAFRIRAAADWNKRDGYLHNHSGIGPDRLGDTNYFAGRLSMVADITSNLENYTILSYSKSNTHGVTPRMFNCNTAAALTSPLAGNACLQVARQDARGDGNWDVESTDPHPEELVKQWQVINTTTWQAADTLTVKNILSYAEYKEAADFSLWGDNLLNPSFLVPFLGPVIPTIKIHPGVTGYTSAQSTFTEELQLQGRSSDDRFKWQAGAYLELSNPLGFSSSFADIFINCSNSIAYQCTNPLGIGSISATNYKDKFDNRGLYTQATYALTDQFSITGGFRYTMDRQTDVNRGVNINFPPSPLSQFTCQNAIKFGAGFPADGPASAICEANFATKSKKPTWLIDFDYKPNEDILIFAKYSRGYRQGGVNPNNLGVETWDPEKVDTYESGIKTSFHGSMPGYFNVVGFYNDFSNQQLSVNSTVAPAFAATVPPIQAVVNAGKSRIWGAEVDAAIKPIEGLKLDAGYTYLNTRLVSITLPTPPIYYQSFNPTAVPGGPLSLSPKNRYTLSATYALPLNESSGTVSLGATYTHTDANEALQQEFSPFLYKIKASNLLNLNADWQSILGQPVDFSLFMTNATNEKLVTFPAGSWETIGADVGHVNQPRMFGARVKYRFGS